MRFVYDERYVETRRTVADFSDGFFSKHCRWFLFGVFFAKGLVATLR